MKRSMDEILSSMRRELERGFKDAVNTLDYQAREDFKEVSSRLKKLKDEELRLVEQKVSDVRESIQTGEAFRPYLAALNAAIKTYREVKTGKPEAPRKKKTQSRKKTKVANQGKKKTTKRKTSQRKSK